jgi:hypothetical protein
MHTYTYIHTYTYDNTHTCAHTHTCEHTYTPSWPSELGQSPCHGSQAREKRAGFLWRPMSCMLEAVAISACQPTSCGSHGLYAQRMVTQHSRILLFDGQKTIFSPLCMHFHTRKLCAAVSAIACQDYMYGTFRICICPLRSSGLNTEHVSVKIY